MPESIPAPRKTIDALTGIRFFAAAWVVLFHFGDELRSIFPGWRHAERFTASGYLGVDLFFILSGFIIAYTYLATFTGRVRLLDVQRFLWLRLARMYPVHLFTLVVLLGVVFAAQQTGRQLSNPYGPTDFGKNVMLINAWFGSEDQSWNYPAWSISAEWFAYLLFPLAATVVARARSARANAIGAGLSLAILLVAMLAYDLYNPLLRVSGEFVAGMFLARLFAVTAYSALWEWAAALALLAVPLAVMTTRGAPRAILTTALFAIMVISLAHARRGVVGLLSNRWVIRLGEASYALYMTHALVEMIVGNVLPMQKYAHSSLAVRSLIVAGYVAILAASAFGTHHFIENPARDRLRRRKAATPADPHHEDGLRPYSVQVPMPRSRPEPATVLDH